MITVEVTGREALVLRLQGKLDNVRAAVRREVATLTEQLRVKVRGKITGGPLHGKPDGKLASSIRSDLTETPDTIVGRVFSTGVPYARIQEYGGVTRPHLIVPRNAQALRFMSRGNVVFARVVHHPGSRIPERSYLRSSLDDMRAEIIDRLTTAVRAAARTG